MNTYQITLTFHKQRSASTYESEGEDKLIALISLLMQLDIEDTSNRDIKTITIYQIMNDQEKIAQEEAIEAEIDAAIEAQQHHHHEGAGRNI